MESKQKLLEDVKNFKTIKELYAEKLPRGKAKD